MGWDRRRRHGRGDVPADGAGGAVGFPGGWWFRALLAVGDQFGWWHGPTGRTSPVSGGGAAILKTTCWC